MWSQRVLRPLRPQIHRTVRFSRRSYNGQQFQGPHTTYFQQPPPAPPRTGWRIVRGVLLGTTCFLAGMACSVWAFIEDDEEDEYSTDMADATAVLAQELAARKLVPMDSEIANEFLKTRAGYSIAPKAVGHSCQLASNLPCEDKDVAGLYNTLPDPQRNWAFWGVFDGHAGPRTAQILKEVLPSAVGSKLMDSNCMERSYLPMDYEIIRAIKKAFKEVDDEMLTDAASRARAKEGDLAHTITAISVAVSGSCALMALFDPVKSVLRVANTGDSRAVLGRWDGEAGKYIARPMSVDQTGFNQEEVERLRRQHPDEECVDPKTGRVHGIMVSRAFGDARWKWPNELTQMVHEKFWGPAPRPNGVIKTPPYLTPEPEITEVRIQTDQHPDFLIMASDGLWDNISCDNAVTCVQMWLDKFKPEGFLKSENVIPTSEWFKRKKNSKLRQYKSPPPPEVLDDSVDEETYYDENERTLKWRVSPKHFVVEDENCGIHLVKNALGGSRRNLFHGVLSVQAPHSRKVRDDITVHVIFFGVDTQEAIKN